MESLTNFRLWLDNTTDYTKATKSNIVSRLKRADRILPISATPSYIFFLSESSEFQELTVSVKSQIRKAVRIYLKYKEGESK